jgi:hypothetical protein
MELPGSKYAGGTFYHTFLDPRKVENSVIEFDLENLRRVLADQISQADAQKVATRVNDHFVDTSRIIKRCFGNKYEHDFQQYNWGLSLTTDCKHSHV